MNNKTEKGMIDNINQKIYHTLVALDKLEKERVATLTSYHKKKERVQKELKIYLSDIILSDAFVHNRTWRKIPNSGIDRSVKFIYESPLDGVMDISCDLDIFTLHVDKVDVQVSPPIMYSLFYTREDNTLNIKCTNLDAIEKYIVSNLSGTLLGSLESDKTTEYALNSLCKRYLSQNMTIQEFCKAFSEVGNRKIPQEKTNGNKYKR